LKSRAKIKFEQRTKNVPQEWWRHKEMASPQQTKVNKSATASVIGLVVREKCQEQANI
jgi:hypothetical protein